MTDTQTDTPPLKKDGTPRQRPGPKPGSPQRGGRGSRSRKPDYRPAVGGLLQLVSTPLIILGSQRDEYLADAAAISLHAQPIVEAVNDLAQTNPQVARVLDSLTRVGPYGALLTAVVPLAIQLAVNHRVIPHQVAEGLGAQNPEALVGAVRQEAARQTNGHSEN